MERKGTKGRTADRNEIHIGHVKSGGGTRKFAREERRISAETFQA